MKPNFSSDYEFILQRINSIDPVKYAKSRNFIDGDITYLSPYISRGVISVKQIMNNIFDKGYTFNLSEKLIQEFAWREYYQRIWQAKNNLIFEDLKQTQPDIVHHKMITAIQNGNTGITVLDNAIKNLYDHGYLHNHLRMYIASIACNIGKAHWLHPSVWMYYYLLDGDVASNVCSWQWVSGAFSNKKYYCNQENINKYTGSIQTGTYLDDNYENVSKINIPTSLIDTSIFKLKTHLPKTSSPKIDVTKPTLVYNSYNLDPIWRNEIIANRILLLEPSHFLAYPVSLNVLQFILDLSKNINGIQVYVGEISDIEYLYQNSGVNISKNIISKEHPAFKYYPGIKDERDWMFPLVTGYYPSFFSFWKKCQLTFKEGL
jgi:deoxyribodipyrimidine photo-lyase